MKTQQEPAHSTRRYLGEGPPGKVSCQPASRGSSPAVVFLHVFSSVNEQAAKETMSQERRAKRQRLGHCRSQSLLPSIPKCTTNQLHHLNTFGNIGTIGWARENSECCSITPLLYHRVDMLLTHSLKKSSREVLGSLPCLCSL